MSAVPHESAWQRAQRDILLRAADGRGRRARKIGDETLAVVAVIAARTPRAFVSTGEIATATCADVMPAVCQLEDAGLLAPGSAVSGRLSLVGPKLLELLGLSSWSLGPESRPDVRPSGTVIELSGARLDELGSEIR